MRRFTKTPTMTSAPVLREAIISAVATLDQSDGSRVHLIESIDNARRTLSDVMPDNFDDLVTEYMEAETEEYDEDEDEDQEDEDEYEDEDE